jgi:hypothetical protein
MVLSVVAHDSFGLGPVGFGFIIAAPGLLWAIAGLCSGSHPAPDDKTFRQRALSGGTTIACGVAVILATTLRSDGPPPPFLGLLGRCLNRPGTDDGISEDRMAAAVVIAESVGLALATTAAYTWLGGGLGLVEAPIRRAQVLYLVLLPLAGVMLHRLSAVTPRPARAASPAPPPS